MHVSVLFVFLKQKTAYEMRISYWSSDVCYSDLSRLFLTGIYERSRRSLTLFFLRKLEMALPPYLTISSATMPTGFAKRGFSLGQQSRAHGIGSYLPENGTPRVGNKIGRAHV